MLLFIAIPAWQMVIAQSSPLDSTKRSDTTHKRVTQDLLRIPLLAYSCISITHLVMNLRRGRDGCSGACAVNGLDASCFPKSEMAGNVPATKDVIVAEQC